MTETILRATELSDALQLVVEIIFQILFGM